MKKLIRKLILKFSSHPKEVAEVKKATIDPIVQKICDKVNRGEYQNSGPDVDVVCLNFEDILVELRLYEALFTGYEIVSVSIEGVDYEIIGRPSQDHLFKTLRDNDVFVLWKRDAISKLKLEKAKHAILNHE